MMRHEGSRSEEPAGARPQVKPQDLKKNCSMFHKSHRKHIYGTKKSFPIEKKKYADVLSE